VRRLVFGAALVALLTILVAAPAFAATSPQRVSANEVRIAQSLRADGLIAPLASPAQIRAAVRAFIGDSDPANLSAKLPQVQRTLSGKRSPFGKFMSSRLDADPSATPTYVSKCLVILADFGSDAWPSGDQTGHNTDGPQYGGIAAPDPYLDNATFWPGDFGRAHYQDMLFGNSFPVYDMYGGLRGMSDDTMANYYLEQSKGSYTVWGQVAGWVHLPYPESYYGANADTPAAEWVVARDAVAQLAADDPSFDWAAYDNENPFGINTANGGAFDQPDGYIDHLIIVHAGVDESAGGGAEGEDAIWAHSWWIYDAYSGGPGGNAGFEIPGSSGSGPNGHVWAGAYTINPEDGGIGVFSHEFGHDLGLPDQYDTTYGGESPSAFWTLMASGSWLGREYGLDTQPAPMNAWDKWALGWNSPKVVNRGKTVTTTLQPAATGDLTKTSVMVKLPNGKHSIELSGKDGSLEWWSNMGDGLDNTLTTKNKVLMPNGSPTLSMNTWYEIETDYDFGFVKVSEDGTTWTYLQSAHTVDLGGGVYGLTGDGTALWGATETYDLSAFAGKSVYVQFEYYTDGGVAWRGWEVGNVKVNTTPLAATAFTSDGWMQVDGAYAASSTRYYMAEFRNRDGFDAALRNVYQMNLDYTGATTTWVDFFRYNSGLHLIYRDTWFNDNNVGDHPGEGGWMVVDARPMPDGFTVKGSDYYWRTRIQVRDAAFSMFKSPAQMIYFTNPLYSEQVAVGKLAQTTFDDSKPWWYSAKWDAGTIVPKKQGVRLIVKSQSPTALKVYVDNVK
jgi:immune inhibitor A